MPNNAETSISGTKFKSHLRLYYDHQTTLLTNVSTLEVQE